MFLACIVIHNAKDAGLKETLELHETYKVCSLHQYFIEESIGYLARIRLRKLQLYSILNRLLSRVPPPCWNVKWRGKPLTLTDS